MTELEFHFHTGVEFSAPVSGHTFALHCLPVEDDAQKLQSYTVRIEPAAEYGLHRDGFGSWLVCGSCREPHTVFCYASHGIVRVDGRAQAEPVNPVLKQFTPLTAMTPELETLWQSLPLDGKPPQEQAALLNKAAAGALHYVPGLTGISTTAGQAFALGSGVCQDYAHILLALARRSGFAARYCMGLAPGEGATHAWAELVLPDGWHGYDPTFACEAGEEHLRFAVGRDAADCRAERGIFCGAAEQTLHTEMRLDVREG